MAIAQQQGFLSPEKARALEQQVARTQRRAALTAQERDLRLEEARSEHAQATLFYALEASRSEPLLTQAAELAETDVGYWIECGRARLAIGSLERAATAFQTARDLPDALDVYNERHAIAEKLAAADPGNAGWQRDLIVSHVKLSALVPDKADARTHLTAALGIARALQAAGRLAPVDAWMPADLEQRLAALDK